MSACRPFTEEEVPRLMKAFDGEHAIRNRALLSTGICTGFRIAELLALRGVDVFEHGEVLEEVSLPRKYTKGKKKGKIKTLYPDTREHLLELIIHLQNQENKIHENWRLDRPIFYSRRGAVLNETSCWRIINNAAKKAKIPTRGVGTHSMRKTFADNMYDFYDNLARKGAKIDVMRMVQLELDHESIDSTYRYMEFKLRDKPKDVFDRYNMRPADIYTSTKTG